MMHPAIFLDRDGVINRNRLDHVKAWSEFEFLPGALAALRRLAQLKWPIVVVSNQAMIDRGLVSHAAVDEINRSMCLAIQQAGGRIDAVFYCPHRPDENCVCRKPRPGLLRKAAAQLQLDLTQSFLIGDADSDILAAQAVGCRSILVKTGRGLAHLTLLRRQDIQSFHIADDLSSAVDWILREIACSTVAVL